MEDGLVNMSEYVLDLLNEQFKTGNNRGIAGFIDLIDSWQHFIIGSNLSFVKIEVVNAALKRYNAVKTSPYAVTFETELDAIRWKMDWSCIQNTPSDSNGFFYAPYIPIVIRT